MICTAARDALSWRDRVAGWIGGKRTATQPIAFHPPSPRFFGPGINDNQPAHHVLLQESIGTAHTATLAIADRISMLNPQVLVSRRDQNGTLLDEVLDDHVLKTLLDKPHPDFTRSMMLRTMTFYLVSVGECYWLKVGNRLGVPVELHLIPPGQIEPILAGGVTVAFSVQAGDGQKIVLPRDVIVRCYMPDPEVPWRSEGFLGPQGLTADALKFSKQHMRAFYQNDATPKVALEASENAVPFSQESREAFYDAWKQKFHNRTGDQIGTPAIGPTGYKFVELSTDFGEHLVPLLEFWRDEILMGFGTPRSILGQVESGDRSSVEATNFNFDQKRISPLTKLIEETFTDQLARDFDPALFVRFEPFVSEDKEYELKREAQDLEHGVREINRVLEDRGDDAVPWGEKPTVKSGITVFDPDAPAPVPMEIGAEDLESPDEDEDEPPERAVRRRQAARKRRNRRRRVRRPVIEEVSR